MSRKRVHFVFRSHYVCMLHIPRPDARRSLHPAASTIWSSKYHRLPLHAPLVHTAFRHAFHRPRLFEVPAHPCLASRRPKEATENALDANIEKPTSASKLSTIQLRNFAVDLTTLHLMMKALNTSSDVDTLTFHNAGLTQTSIAVLVKDLQRTSVRSLGLDYILPPSPPPVRPSASERRLKAAELAAEAGNKTMESEAASTCLPSRPDFAGLVGEGNVRTPESRRVSMQVGGCSFLLGVERIVISKL